VNSTDSGATFDVPVNLSNSPTNSQIPKISVSGNNIYVVWVEGNKNILSSLAPCAHANMSTPNLMI